MPMVVRNVFGLKGSRCLAIGLPPRLRRADSDWSTCTNDDDVPYCSHLASIRLLRRIVGEKSPLQCAGINRHEAENAKFLRVRSSDPLGPEFCAATARDTAKRRQRLGGVGIQLRKDATRTPTSL